MIHKKKIDFGWKRLVFILIIGLGGVLSTGPFLSTRDEPVLSDAIVVISGGGNERILQGINLYHDKWAPLLIVSGDAFSGYTSNADIMRGIALKKGVPGEDIIVEPASETTYENAFYVKKLLAEKNLSQKKILLVTSEYHVRRARIVFQNVLAPLAVDVRVVPGQTEEWDKWLWWMSKRGWYLTSSEIVKLGYMFITGLSERGELAPNRREFSYIKGP